MASPGMPSVTKPKTCGKINARKENLLLKSAFNEVVMSFLLRACRFSVCIRRRQLSKGLFALQTTVSSVRKILRYTTLADLAAAHYARETTSLMGDSGVPMTRRENRLTKVPQMGSDGSSIEVDEARPRP